MSMSIAEVEKEALALPERERARLAVSLLRTLSPEDADLSDGEVLRRDADIESGRAGEISHEEFVRRVERERAR